MENNLLRLSAIGFQIMNIRNTMNEIKSISIPDLTADRRKPTANYHPGFCPNLGLNNRSVSGIG